MKRLIRTSFIVSFFTLIVFKTVKAQYWEPLGGGVQGIGIVEALYSDTIHNKLYVGGVFNLIGGISATYMAWWDGNAYHAFPVQPNDPVTAFAMKEDTMIFITANSNDFQVGRYVDTVFIDTLPSPGNLAHSLYVFHDTLFAGGEFNAGIKYWNGTQWKKFAGGVGGAFYYVNAISSYNNQLIVGGEFTSAGGVSVNNITTWNGAEWDDMSGGVTWPGGLAYVTALQEFKGKLYVGGDFFYAGGLNTRANAIWDGLNWDTLARPDIGGSCAEIRGFFADDSFLYATGTIGGGCCGCPGDRAGMFDGESWYNLYLNDGDAGYAISVFNGDIIVGTDFKFGWNSDVVNYIGRFLGYPTTITETTEQNSSPIFPNPTSTTITLSLPSNQNAILSIFNLLGEEVKEEKVTGTPASPTGRQVTLDVSSLPQGLYLVRTENSVVGKFVKE